MTTPATIDMALIILARALPGLIRGEDVSRWAGQLEAVLRDLQPRERRR